MRDKKNRERLFLNEVAAIYTDFPSGTISDTERPDFLVSGSSQVIGIEVVDYVRGQNDEGSVHRRNEMLWQQVADKSRQEFEIRYPIPLMVHFLWRSGRYLRKTDVQRIATDAATLIGQHIPQTLFGSMRIDHREFQDTVLRGVVRSISVTRVRNTQQVHWSFIDSGFTSVSVSEIQELITSKDAKVSEYLQVCNAAWLLIVADGLHISSSADLPEQLQQAHFQSLFEKILFYDRPSRRVTTLITQGPSTFPTSPNQTAPL